jgi:hypothetical protein
MNEPLMDYAHLGRWTELTPTHCANATRPHRLEPGRMINGWAECSCGGHRTVQCMCHEGGRTCNAVHYLPRLMVVCSLSGLPRQRTSPPA